MTQGTIKRGGWSIGRALPAQDLFDFKVIEEFDWGYTDLFGAWHSFPGVKILIGSLELRMDRKVLEALMVG